MTKTKLLFAVLAATGVLTLAAAPSALATSQTSAKTALKKCMNKKNDNYMKECVEEWLDKYKEKIEED